jgi:hypothetical protein
MASQSVVDRLLLLENNLRSLVCGGGWTHVYAAIHRHTMLVARVGFLEGAGWLADPRNRGTAFIAAAHSAFPLPPQRLLREEKDPIGYCAGFRFDPHGGADGNGIMQFRAHTG